MFEKKKKRLPVFCGLLLALSLSVASVGVFASADTGTYTAGVMETVPVWAKAHTEHIGGEVTAASASLGAASSALTAVVDDKDRILLGQEFANGSVFMNETYGKAFAVTDADLLAAWRADTERGGVILAPVITSEGAEYLVTDKAVYKKAGTEEVADHTYTVGQLPEDYATIESTNAKRLTADRLTDRFADAYKFAVNYNAADYTLGVPTSAVTPQTYTILNLKTNGKYDGENSSEKTYYVQDFEGGKIIQARLDNSPHYAAAPISTAMYAKVVAITDNATLNVTGAPVTRQFTVGNTVYQNFEYGYVKSVDSGAAEFVADKAVSPKGTEMSRIIAAFEDNWVRTFNTNYLHIAYEQVRKTEQRLAALGDFIDNGGIPYDGFNDPIADQAINHPMHEFMGRGALLKMSSSSCGPKAGGMNCFVVAGYWYDDMYVINNADFTSTAPKYIGAYFKEGENKIDGSDNFTGPGFPTGKTTTYKSVKYQTYTNAIIYQSDVDADYTCIKGADYTAWMEGYDSAEAALVGHGIVWEPSGDLPILEEEGTYKAANYSASEGSVTVYYDDEAKSFTFSEKLYEAWVDGRSTFANACIVSGVPVYAGNDYLITTKYYFDASGAKVEKKAGLGTLAEGTENVFGVTEYTSNVAAILTDGFADAYQLAYSRNGHLLGKPTGDAQIDSFKDTLGDESDISYVIQTFENGVIIQGSYNDPAVAIFGNVLDAVNTLGYDKTGLPISRQYTHEGKTYCNFTFGYLTIEAAATPAEGGAVAEPTATMTYDKAVGTKGNEIDRNIGRMENRANIAKGGADYEHEMLRIYEAYVAEYERVTATGFKLYTGSVAPGHEWNANGLTQSYIAGSSTSTAWGQQKLTVMVMSSPFDKAYIVRNMILDTYATKGGNNQAGNFGMPISDEFQVTVEREKDGETVEIVVTFQNFERGTIYSYVNTVDDAYVNAVAGGNADSTGTIVNGDETVELDIIVGQEQPIDPGPVTPDPDDGKDPEDENGKGGCNSSVGATSVVLAGAFLCSALIGVRRKKRN